TALAQVQWDLASQRRAFDRIATQLDIFERHVIERLNFIIDQPFRNMMTGCLNYERTNGQMMSPGKDIDCVEAIRGYLAASYDPLLSGDWTPLLDDPTVLGPRIEDEDWGANINLFRGIARERYGYSFPDRRANPYRWAIAAGSYTALVAENPSHFQAL